MRGGILLQKYTYTSKHYVCQKIQMLKILLKNSGISCSQLKTASTDNSIYYIFIAYSLSSKKISVINSCKL